MKDVYLNNPIRTGSVNIGFANVTSLLTSGGLFLTGTTNSRYSSAGTVLAPRFAAKLMTSP